MFKFLMNDDGARRDIELSPKPESLRERFAFWLLRKFAGRTTVVVISNKVRHFPSNEEAQDAWRERMKEWNKQRLEDVSLLELSIDETTGAFE